MILEDKKKALLRLSAFLEQFSSSEFIKNDSLPFNDDFFENFIQQIQRASSLNGWFTKEQLVYTFWSWTRALQKENIDKWLSSYDFTKEPLKNVGLILAGNIPLVGFHDVLCVLISGNKAIIKLSSNDQNLIPILLDYLVRVAPEFKDRILITKDALSNFDATIATGSNNTSRYFDYYFSKVPSIIRKNRHSVAVLNGNESFEDLQALGEDIFRYYGLGCRSISKLLVPKDYDFKTFFEAIYSFSYVINYEKYANNYDYNKAVFLMSNFKILDNGFLTLRQAEGFASPISSVFYEYYNDLSEIEQLLKEKADEIQCVVSNENIPGSVAFGSTQCPNLWDYADDIDTLDFLLNLN